MCLASQSSYNFQPAFKANRTVANLPKVGNRFYKSSNFHQITEEEFIVRLP